MTDRPEVILVYSSIKSSIIQDVVGMGTIAATVAVGWFLDSVPLQWIGGLVCILSLIIKAQRISSDNTFTLEKARKRLDEIEQSFGK